MLMLRAILNDFLGISPYRCLDAGILQLRDDTLHLYQEKNQIQAIERARAAVVSGACWSQINVTNHLSPW